MTDTSEVLTLHEAAAALGVHYMTAYRYLRTGRLQGTKVGGTWRVRRDDLDSLDADGSSNDADSDTGSTRRAPHAQRLERRLLKGDEAGAWTVVEAALAGGMRPAEVYQGVLAPAMRAIGEDWAAGKVSVDEEHLATAVAQRLVGRLGPRFARRGRKRGTVVLAAPPGDAHGLPTALTADLLRGEGFEVVDLGADVPAESLAHAVTAARPVAVGLCCTSPENESAIAEALESLVSVTESPVFVGGLAAPDAGWVAEHGGAARTSSVDEVVARLDDLVQGTRAS
jgi:excisionase family DNA binding protein